MNHEDSHEPFETSDSPTGDIGGGAADLQTRRVERFVLAGAIIGPILLGLLAWLGRQRPFGFGIPWTVTNWFFHSVEHTITLGITTWLAWRQPILGEKRGRSLMLVIFIVSAFMAVQYWRTHGAWSGIFLQIMIASQFTLFLTGVAVMVLARRLFGIVLVRRDEHQIANSSRLSIRELMLWTVVIASILSVYQQITRWIDGSDASVVETPGWFHMYHLLATHVPTAS